MEIAEIASQLANLAGADVLREDARVACVEAASLLKQVRHTVLGKNRHESDSEVVERLREILAKQGEG